MRRPAAASVLAIAHCLAFALTVCVAPALRAEAPRCEQVSLRRMKPMMATLVTITVRGCESAFLESRVREAFAEMERLAAILSEWNAESAVSLVNAKAGMEPVPVPRELWEVLEAAQETSARTSGAFDATWGALGELWRFDGKPPHLPPAGEVERLRKLVGYRDLVLDPAARTAFLKQSGMRLGLGGLAKGYIAQAAADLLVSRGVADVLVAASGDITARGRNGDRPWKVAVRDPRVETAVLATVELHDESISTAGDYERFFTIAGRRYHHILDPTTGYPATGTRSVTVIARRGVVADALDTGLFVLGWQRGKRVAASAGILALFVDEAGNRHFSEGASEHFLMAKIGSGSPR